MLEGNHPCRWTAKEKAPVDKTEGFWKEHGPYKMNDTTPLGVRQHTLTKTRIAKVKDLYTIVLEQHDLFAFANFGYVMLGDVQ